MPVSRVISFFQKHDKTPHSHSFDFHRVNHRLITQTPQELALNESICRRRRARFHPARCETSGPRAKPTLPPHSHHGSVQLKVEREGDARADPREIESGQTVSAYHPVNQDDTPSNRTRTGAEGGGGVLFND